MTGGPCFNCPDRTLGCHGTCQKYLAWTDQYHAEKAKADEARQKERALDGLGRHIYGRHKARR